MVSKLIRLQRPNVPDEKLAFGARVNKFDGDEKELELEADLELDIDDLELGAGLRKSKPRNIVEKLELARLKRALDRGEKLSPNELTNLGRSSLPQAKGLIDKNKALSEPRGLKLSPFRALLRGL